MMSSRYFENPYNASGNVEISPELCKNRLKMIVEKILKGLQPTKKAGEKGIYTGTAGVAYCLYYLIQQGILPEYNEKFLHLAVSYVSVALDPNSVRCRKNVGLLSGNGGVYLVATLIYNKLGDTQKSKNYLQAYQSLASLCEPLKFLEDGCDEIFVGRAGYMLGVLALQQALKIEVLPESQLNSIWEKMIESGRSLRDKYKNLDDLPLLYQYHGKSYLGAAHGFGGILQALLSFPQFVKSDVNAAQMVKMTVDFILSRCVCNGNVATNLDGALSSHGKYLVHWCHGAAGIIYTFARAYIVFGKEEKYLRTCEGLAETVWEQGLLKKGPGICHGVAGSGYVFLLMYRLTGNRKYLYRAERFADFLFSDVFNAEARTPDRPFSLYEGLAGTACFIADLLQPDKAAFPLLDIFLE